METFTGESGRLWSYDVAQSLGAGGMGQVFAGTDDGGRPIAVKRVRLPADTEGDRRRREREVEIGARLSELAPEHILPTLDVGRIGDDLLIVMPRATRSLAAAIMAGTIDQPQALRALQEIAEGLVELAELSLVHRDLKPANILECDGRWLLSDFGIARDLQELTGTYTFLGAGTYAYMAPELWQGLPATVKSDLYALGVVGFELLLGTRPFLGPTERDYRSQHQTSSVPDVSALTAGLQRLLRRLLAKTSTDRPQDARAVVEQLVAEQSPLSEAQRRLRLTVARLEQQKSFADAEKATAEAAEAVRQAAVAQASAELQQVLEEAEQAAQAALGDVKLSKTRGVWTLRWSGGGELLIHDWRSVPGLEAQEPHFNDICVSAGVVNPGDPGKTWPLANIACGFENGRLRWEVWRFRSSGLVANN